MILFVSTKNDCHKIIMKMQS